MCVYGFEPIDFIVENRKKYYECEMVVAWLRILLKMKCSALWAPTDGDMHSALFDAGVLGLPICIQQYKKKTEQNSIKYFLCDCVVCPNLCACDDHKFITIKKLIKLNEESEIVETKWQNER